MFGDILIQAAGTFLGVHALRASDGWKHRKDHHPGLIPRRKPPRKTQAVAKRGGAKRNPSTLQRQARAFHGEGAGDLVKLSPKERKLPAVGVLLGEVSQVGYEPDRRSKRGANEWVHRFGDRGPGKPTSTKKPLLVAFADGRTAIVQGKSPARFRPSMGIVG